MGVKRGRARDDWLLIELGESSAQTARREPDGQFAFISGIARDPDRPVALARPGDPTA